MVHWLAFIFLSSRSLAKSTGKTHMSFVEADDQDIGNDSMIEEEHGETNSFKGFKVYEEYDESSPELSLFDEFRRAQENDSPFDDPFFKHFKRKKNVKRPLERVNNSKKAQKEEQQTVRATPEAQKELGVNRQPEKVRNVSKISKQESIESTPANVIKNTNRQKTSPRKNLEAAKEEERDDMIRNFTLMLSQLLFELSKIQE